MDGSKQPRRAGGKFATKQPDNGEPNAGADSILGGGASVDEGSYGIIDPASVITGNAGSEEPAKRGRGRPRKDSGNAGGRGSGGDHASQAKTKKVDITSGVEALLVSIHLGVASALSEPSMILEEKEAAQLAKAINNVSRHYDFAPSSKVVDWGNLFIAIGSVYAPRIVAMRMRQKANEKTPSPLPVSGNASVIHAFN